MHQLTMNVPAAAHGADPAPDPSELERIAMTALEVGRLLMETGARAEIVHEDCSMVARSFGADRVDLRSGYASVDITVGRGGSTITRTMEVGPHGVDHRLGECDLGHGRSGPERQLDLRQDARHRGPPLGADTIGFGQPHRGLLARVGHQRRARLHDQPDAARDLVAGHQRAGGRRRLPLRERHDRSGGAGEVLPVAADAVGASSLTRGG